MERRRTEDVGQTADGDPEARRSSEDVRSVAQGASPAGAQSSATERDVTSWVNWQSTLYIFVLGTICFFLAPLTSLWWLVLVCGVVVPLALAVRDRPILTFRRPDDRKGKEQELLQVLAETDELTSTTAAMKTSLTVDEASKMLEELAGKGHLKVQVEDGGMAYALRERDRQETPGELTPRRLEDPLSERELEVLTLLASGRTNSEIARDLFVSVGTVKSHTGNIYRKLDARNRAAALARARELDLLQ